MQARTPEEKLLKLRQEVEEWIEAKKLKD